MLVRSPLLIDVHRKVRGRTHQVVLHEVEVVCQGEVLDVKAGRLI